jgi:Na+/H+-dicarboxylate symporter
MKWWIKQQLYLQILIGIIIGILLGLLLQENVSYIKPIGDIFINLLMMLIVPLTFFTLIAGIIKLENINSLKSLGGKTILFYASSSLVSAAIGIGVALLLNPGEGAIGFLSSNEHVKISEFNMVENIVSWFPQNPINAMAEGKMLQIIIFSIIIGIGMLSLGKKVKILITFTNECSDLMITITEFIMKTAPYGIMALVANMVANMQGKMLKEVGIFIITDYLAILFILIVLYPVLLKFIAKYNPVKFYRNISPAMFVAASTTSSAATLPVSIAVAKDHLNIPEKIWGFTLPLGATINMNGMAAVIGVIAVFASNLYGIEITIGLILHFIFLGMALSIGTAGVKGAGIVMSSILLQALEMPLTIIPILAAIWPIVDIAHTSCNVTGDLVATTIIDTQMKKHN